MGVVQDSIANSGSSYSVLNLWFIAEILLIICVIIYQIYHTRKVFLDIQEMKGIFSKQLIIKNGFIEKVNLKKKIKSIKDIVFFDNNVEDNDDIFSDQNTVKISIAQTLGKGIVRRMCDDINTYLINNYGATVNFSMIKDIIDREVEVKDEEISNSITTPLYLGLAATMVGIIFGLFSMPGLDDAQFSESITALINGVKLAMFGSLVGLGCTTALSSFFYKDAKKQVLQEKNRQISYLQAMLLPELLKAEESGVSGLKSSIDKFARDTASMANVLYNTTIKTESNLRIQQNILQNQLDVIRKVDSMGINRIAKANLELFDKFERNAHSFNHFSTYLELMGRISNQLQEFASRTSSIDDITRSIAATLSDSKMLTEYLSSHFSEIEKAGGAALKAVDVADSHFKDAIQRLVYSLDGTLEIMKRTVSESSAGFAKSMDDLNLEIQERIKNINHNSIDHESKLTEIYSDIGSKLEILTKEHLNQLGNVYNDSIPKFDELKHLITLPEIKGLLDNNNTDKIVELVSDTNKALNKVNDSVNSSAILNKLSSLEETLRRRSASTKQTPPSPNPKVTENLQPENKPVSILSAIKFVFSNKQ